jgi:hypothetical protein
MKCCTFRINKCREVYEPHFGLMVVLIERKILQRNAIVLYPRCALSICVAEFIVFVLALSREADCEILREKDTTAFFVRLVFSGVSFWF